MPLVIKRVKVDNPKEAAAAQHEAKLLAELDHPYIVGYIDSFLHKGHLCLVTEYCEGGDLYHRLKESTHHLPEATVLDWLLQTALALAHLHARQIMHRDLKTQNIFLTARGVAKLGDFGIARTLQAGCELAHTIVGTPFFMSPELMASKPYDLKTDLWSLGCVLHEMCCLEHAFSADDMNGLALKILRGTHSPAPVCYTSALRQLINVLLSKDPDCRPSAEQLLEHPLLAARASETAATFEAEAAAHTARLAHARRVAAMAPGSTQPSPSASIALSRAGQPKPGVNKLLRASAPNAAVIRMSGGVPHGGVPRDQSPPAGGGAGGPPPGDLQHIRERLDREAEARRSLEANIRRIQAGGSPDAAARVAAARIAYARPPHVSSSGTLDRPQPRVSQSGQSSPPAERPRRTSYSASPPPRGHHPAPPLSAAVNAQRVTAAAAAAAAGGVRRMSSGGSGSDHARQDLLHLVAEERAHLQLAKAQLAGGGDGHGDGDVLPPLPDAPRQRRSSHAGVSLSRPPPPGAAAATGSQARVIGPSSPISPPAVGPPAGSPPRPRTSLADQRARVQGGRDNSSAALNLARLEREVDAVEAALVAAPRVRRHSEYVSPTRVAEAPGVPDASHAWEESANSNAAVQQRAAALAALRARGAERHARRASSLEGGAHADGAAAASAAARSAADLAHAMDEDAGGPVVPVPEVQSPMAGGEGADPMAELTRLQQMHAALTAHIDELQATLRHAAATGAGSHESLPEAEGWEDTTGSDGPEDGMRTPPGAEDGLLTGGAPASPEERYSRGQGHDGGPRGGSHGGGAEPLLPRGAFAPTGGGAHVRVTALRAACEESLGAPLFNKLYAHFKQAQEQANAARHGSAAGDAGAVPGDATDEVAFREELKARLGPGRAHFVALMDRLLFEEEQVSNAQN